jgi:hypothetical protein
MKQEDLQYFFEKVENGQDLGHHRTVWWALGSKVIGFLSPYSGKKIKTISHCSIITNVDRRTPNVVRFAILQSTKGNGVHILSKMKICKTMYRYELFGFHKDEQIYWSPDISLDNNGLKAFERFQNIVVDKKYSHFLALKNVYIFRILKIYRLFLQVFFGVVIEDIDLAIQNLEDVTTFYCSELSERKDYEVGVISKDKYQDNPYPDPMTFISKKKTIIQIQ